MEIPEALGAPLPLFGYFLIANQTFLCCYMSALPFILSLCTSEKIFCLLFIFHYILEGIGMPSISLTSVLYWRGQKLE